MQPPRRSDKNPFLLRFKGVYSSSKSDPVHVWIWFNSHRPLALLLLFNDYDSISIGATRQRRRLDVQQNGYGAF